MKVFKHFQIFLVLNAATNTDFYKTFNFFVNYSDYRIFPGGFMGIMIGRGIPNILLFILYQRLAIMEAVEI